MQDHPTAAPGDKLMQRFEDLDDPCRQSGRFQYPLQELRLTALCTVAAGAEDWVDVSEWGEFKLEWLRRFLSFEQGIASHDTFSRVFAMLDSVQFEACFCSWMAQICPSLAQEHIAIDGKTLHLVTAWHCGNGVTLGQIRTQAKSNEITAIPELLAGLDLRGATVTMAATGCQKAIVQQLVDEGAGYIIGVKNNQPRRCRVCWSRPRPRPTGAPGTSTARPTRATDASRRGAAWSAMT